MSELDRPLRLGDIPFMNLGRYMLEKMSKFSDLEAMVDGRTGTTFTYRELISRCERLAAGLQQFGVKEGDVVCIVAPNCMDYLTTYYATTLVTAVLQALNPLFTKDDLHKVFKDANTKYVVTVPALVPNVMAAKQGLRDIKGSQEARLSEMSVPKIKHLQNQLIQQIEPRHEISNNVVIVFGKEEGCTSFDSLLLPAGTPFTTPEADWKSTTAALLYSSGTTGFPKAVKLTHYCIVANATQAIHSGLFFSVGESLIDFLPMFHMYGLNCVGAITQTLGCKLVIMERFDFEEYLKLIQKYKPVSLQVVPPIMVLFAKHPSVSNFDLSSIERITCGAAPLSAEIEEAVKNKLKLRNIQQGYGMTEVGVTHANTPDNYRHNSVGKKLVLVETKIVDVETGKTLGTNQEGEVWVRGPQVTNGYHNLPAQTREMFLSDGWVRTGDIGKEDEDGFLYIVDRLKELIKYKGFQVAPATLEDILLRHDAVADVGVVGVQDLEAGELPKAFVVKKKDVTEKELQDFVSGVVAPYMKLRGGVEFIDEIPRSLSGKILRRVLREKAKLSQSKL